MKYLLLIMIGNTQPIIVPDYYPTEKMCIAAAQSTTGTITKSFNYVCIPVPGVPQ